MWLQVYTRFVVDIHTYVVKDLHGRETSLGIQIGISSSSSPGRKWDSVQGADGISSYVGGLCCRHQ